MTVACENNNQRAEVRDYLAIVNKLLIGAKLEQLDTDIEQLKK
jgi:hypothetical protein